MLLQRVEAQSRSEIRIEESIIVNYWSTGKRGWKESDDNLRLSIGVTCTGNSTLSELDLSGWGWQPVRSISLGILSNVVTDRRQLDLSNNLVGSMPAGRH